MRSSTLKLGGVIEDCNIYDRCFCGLDQKIREECSLKQALFYKYIAEVLVCAIKFTCK